VSELLSEFAGVNVSTQKIYNHLRKWRQRWVKIVRLKDLSGALWNEEHHMIVLDDEHLNGHTKGVFAPLYVAGSAHPTGTCQAEPVPSAARARVCVHVANEPGLSDIVFAMLVPIDMVTMYQFLVALPSTIAS
jgi:hypothetical protein